jgi:hypothetical protein
MLLLIISRARLVSPSFKTVGLVLVKGFLRPFFSYQYKGIAVMKKTKEDRWLIS